jgi:hypothetical protein
MFTVAILALCFAVALGETVECNESHVSLVSHRRFVFYNCVNWMDGRVPTIVYAGGDLLVNVTVVVDGCAALPLISCGSDAASAPVVFDKVNNAGIMLEVRNVWMEATRPSRINGHSLWEFSASCSAKVGVSVADSRLYLNSSAPLTASTGALTPCPLLLIAAKDMVVSVVWARVTLEVTTYNSQSLILVITNDDDVAPSNVTISASNVSLSMIGQPLPESVSLSDHVVQAIFQVERRFLFDGGGAIANVVIVVSGRCHFHVEFQLEEENVTPLGVLNTSYFAHVLMATSGSTSTGALLRNFTVVFLNSGSYTTSLHGSQSATVFSAEKVNNVRDCHFAFHNIAAHHTLSSHMSTLRDNSRVLAIFDVSPCLVTSTVILANITARFGGHQQRCIM